MDIDKKKDQPGRSWEHIDSDLRDALNTWSDLTQELADKMSPEETQLKEIKTLLGTLRDKLNEFNEESSVQPKAAPADHPTDRPTKKTQDKQD